jgi:glutathione peroxidase-family protein
MEKTYVGALTLMQKENVLEKFADRAGKVVSDTSGIGWGFHDFLIDAYSNFYADYTNYTDEENEKQQGKIIKLCRQ